MKVLIKVGAVALAVASMGLCAAAMGQAAPKGPVVQRAEAAGATGPERCWKLRLDGKKDAATDCFATLARSSDAYERAEGYWGMAESSQAPWDEREQLWKNAGSEFEAAIKQPKAPALWKARYGMLLHERFNDVDSPPLFEEALADDPKCAEALLGLAEIGAANFDNKAEDYLRRTVALGAGLAEAHGLMVLASPSVVEAHELLANLLLEDAQPEEAIKEANAAIALSPYEGGSDALDAMATLAAADLLADKNADADAWMARIKAVNPGYGEGYLSVAKHLMLNRRYPEAIAYDRKAVETDPELWSAHSDLGINLMRMGDEVEAEKELELAYANGQTDAATANSLKLLDLYPKFVTTKDATTTLMLWNTEDPLLRPYFEAQLHKAIETYTAKYKMKLNGPVRLEVYPNHDDFAVRTMGMPGLGALGVTFGNVVAMDSPSGRTPGEFNWGATMWHELSHVFILSATNYRVPRWFTEGLAVHEEGQADPKWANRLTPEVVAAIKAKKLLPVAQMDQGFIFPKYPEQVLVSYWQAGTICDYITERWGNDAILGMVHSFAALKTTPEAIQENLHESPEQFDKDYAAWIDKKVGPTVANFDAWRTQLKALAGMAADGDSDKVIASASTVINMYPDYVEDANAYEFLATVQALKGNKQGAADTLKEYEQRGGEDPKTLEQLASLEADLGHPKEAAATLDELNFIYPEDEDLHRKLGALWLAQGNDAGAIREYQAVLAMNPLDKASAEFDLAKAYLAAGDKAKAEDSVLASLEAAPDFKDAQKLLLEIEAGK